MKRTDDSQSTGIAAEQRRKGILTAALAVFGRYGFRKTSMDEVARAAEISRQGLYLHFATKEELFRALVAHMLGTCFADAEAVLRDPALPLEQKLAGAFGEWMGRHVGLVGKDAADLIQAAHSLMGDEIREFEKRNLEAITRTLRKTDFATAYAARGITTRQLAAHLLAIARGLKCHCASPGEFRQEFSLSLKILFSVLAVCEKFRRGTAPRSGCILHSGGDVLESRNVMSAGAAAAGVRG